MSEFGNRFLTNRHCELAQHMRITNPYSVAGGRTRHLGPLIEALGMQENNPSVLGTDR